MEHFAGMTNTRVMPLADTNHREKLSKTQAIKRLWGQRKSIRNTDLYKHAYMLYYINSFIRFAFITPNSWEIDFFFSGCEYTINPCSNSSISRGKEYVLHSISYGLFNRPQNHPQRTCCTHSWESLYTRCFHWNFSAISWFDC